MANNTWCNFIILISRFFHVAMRFIELAFDKSHFIYELVPKLSVETTNICSSKCVFCPNAIMKRPREHLDMVVFKKAIDEFVKMGGFDSSLGYADDRTFFIKYNARSKRVKDAICYHKNAETLKEVFKQSVWIGSSINQKWIRIRGLNFLILLGTAIIFPIAIIPLSINKSHKIKNFKVFFPWMIIFMSVRYAGMLKGIYRRIFYGWNFR